MLKEKTLCRWKRGRTIDKCFYWLREGETQEDDRVNQIRHSAIRLLWCLASECMGKAEQAISFAIVITFPAERLLIQKYIEAAWRAPEAFQTSASARSGQHMRFVPEWIAAGRVYIFPTKLRILESRKTCLLSRVLANSTLPRFHGSMTEMWVSSHQALS